jgi:cytochrome c
MSPWSAGSSPVARWWAALALAVGLLPAAVAAGSLQRTVLAPGLTEPIAHDVAADGRVFLAERPGHLKVWDPGSGELRSAGHLHVLTGPEDGLLCLALSPGFATNQWVFLFHSTPGVLENRVSRFTLTNGVLDAASQKILLRIPTLIPKPNHSGGGLGFDAAGNLYVSTGDYTYAGQSDGYAPLDRRPGHELNDSERTAANTADFRGKILRVHPEPDGTYQIPPGNLFPPGTADARPEIYVMGCRNPFRFSVDPVSGWLYWGDVGPDALGSDPARGPAGFDEFNVATAAGNFGWPYFQADNRPYLRWDFATKTTGVAFDPAAPDNDSPHNTGLKRLPPAQPAFLWYPAGPSSRWPELGSGARSAMAGPVYHFAPGLASARKLPAEFDGAVFLHEWERGWIKAVWLDEQHHVRRMAPVLPETRFKRPISLKFGPDGALYVLEWGSNWSNNRDSALVRIESAKAP